MRGSRFLFKNISHLFRTGEGLYHIPNQIISTNLIKIKGYLWSRSNQIRRGSNISLHTSHEFYLELKLYNDTCPRTSVILFKFA